MLEVCAEGMQAGLEFDNDSHTIELYETASGSAEYVLSLKMLSASGTFMSYNDGAPHLVSKAIDKKNRKNVEPIR